MTDEPTTATYETHAVVYLNDGAAMSADLTTALLGEHPDLNGARFTRVAGDGPDNGYAYAGLPGSTIATIPSVFVIAGRFKSTDVHAVLASLPWGAIGSAVAIINGTDKAKPQVNVIGRWGAPA